MRAKISIFLLLALSCFFCNPNNAALAGNISESHPLPFFSFIKYHVVDSYLDGNIYTRTIKLEVKNTSDQTISNTIALIDAYPEYVTCSGNNIDLGNIDPGGSVISNDAFQISVDMDQQNGSELKLIWRVECDTGGEHILDESSVVEVLE